MEDKNLTLEIFNQIETMEEYYKVCKSFNFLLELNVIADCEFLRLVSQMTFRKLIRIKNGN
jgi:hypothetical protein